MFKLNLNLFIVNRIRTKPLERKRGKWNSYEQNDIWLFCFQSTAINTIIFKLKPKVKDDDVGVVQNFIFRIHPYNVGVVRTQHIILFSFFDNGIKSYVRLNIQAFKSIDFFKDVVWMYAIWFLFAPTNWIYNSLCLVVVSKQENFKKINGSGVLTGAMKMEKKICRYTLLNDFFQGSTSTVVTLAVGKLVFQSLKRYGSSWC